MSDYQQDYETRCPHCGHSPIHWCECQESGCDDGQIDTYEQGRLWDGSDETETCTACYGTGIVQWCPNCGADVMSGVVEVAHE